MPIKRTDITFRKLADRFRERDVITEARTSSIVGQTYENVFYISNIQRASLVRQIQTSLANALDDGMSFEDWKQTDVVSSIRNISEAQKQTIFRTNLNTAYHDGIKEQVTATGGYLRYSATLDQRVRPSHEALHDITLPATDSFWNNHTPALGFNCRCTLIPVSRARARRDNLKTDRRTVRSKARRFRRNSRDGSFRSDSLSSTSYREMMENRLNKLQPSLRNGIKRGTRRVLNRIKQLRQSLFQGDR